MNIFEPSMLTISNKVNINQWDRAPYTKDFDKIRDYVLSMMKEDEVFRRIFAGPSLFGSYMYKAKNDFPDEFDVHVKLKPPFNELIKVKRDPKRPGFINLNFQNLLYALANSSPQHQMIGKRLKKFIGRRSTVIRGRLNDWFEQLIEAGFQKYGNRYYGYVLDYNRLGTAHAIFAKSGDRKIKIDFVAAFVFDKSDWLAPKPFPYGIKTNVWYAVPKPTGGPMNSKRRYTFSICAPQVERDILWNKMHLKSSLRLLKALTVRHEHMRRLKSYFILTVYLWECENNDDNFWKLSIGEIFVYMLGRLLTYFEDEELPCYWDDRQNLLDIFTDQEIEDYTGHLRDLYNKFCNYSHEPNLTYERVESFFSFKSSYGIWNNQ